MSKNFTRLALAVAVRRKLFVKTTAILDFVSLLPRGIKYFSHSTSETGSKITWYMRPNLSHPQPALQLSNERARAARRYDTFPFSTTAVPEARLASC
jgi:hypothetical protein